jgi:hypothetical protein
MKVRKKPVVLEALQWTGTNWKEMLAWSTRAETDISERNGHLIVNTLEGTLRAEPGDWIICGLSRELYPVKAEIFRLTYEEVPEESPPA